MIGWSHFEKKKLFFILIEIVIWWIFLYRNLSRPLEQSCSSANSASMSSKIKYTFLYWFRRDHSLNTNTFIRSVKVFMFGLQSCLNQYKNIYSALEDIDAELAGEQLCSNGRERFLYKKIHQITISIKIKNRNFFSKCDQPITDHDLVTWLWRHYPAGYQIPSLSMRKIYI